MIREVQKLAHYEFNYKECLDEETNILNMFSWKLMVITPLHLLQSFIGMGIAFEDDRIKTKENG